MINSNTLQEVAAQLTNHATVIAKLSKNNQAIIKHWTNNKYGNAGNQTTIGVSDPAALIPGTRISYNEAKKIVAFCQEFEKLMDNALPVQANYRDDIETAARLEL